MTRAEPVVLQPAQSAKRGSKFGAGCLFVFAMPFAGVGVLAGFTAVRGFLQSQPPDDVWGLAIFALLFGGAGFGLMAFAIYSVVTAGRVPKEQLQHPAQPWMWRKEWAEGRVSDGSGAGVIGMWIFALIWSAVSAPAAWMALTRSAENNAVLWVLLFPLVGVILIAAAVYQTLRHLKFGTSTLVLQTIPASIGGRLRGRIETKFSERPPAVLLRLSTIRRVTSGSGKSRSTTEHVQWEDSIELIAGSLPSGVNGIEIPVSFEIPRDASPTDDSNRDNQILWRLSVSASLPGVDYSASFEVPVYDTGAEPLSQEELEAARELRRSRARRTAPPEPRVLITTSGGRTELVFPPRRKAGSILSAAITIAVMAAIVYALTRIGASGIAAIVGMIALFLTLAAVGSFFYTARVTVDRSAIAIRHSVLGFVFSSRDLQVSDIDDVSAHVSGQYKATQWEVMVRMKAGQRFTAATMITDQREAEWIADRILQAIRF